MRSDELRRALGRRVTARVAGRGVARPDIEAAVARVVAALAEAAMPAADAFQGIAEPPAFVIAAFTAMRPDLASCVRALLRQAGAGDSQLGSARAGRHVAVTARVPGSARDAVRHAAVAAGVAVAFADGSGSAA